jgi:predicted ATPase
MRLKVEGFGPISYADVEMKPLTVLIGRNNAGKSMLAQLAFTLAALTEAPTPMQVLEPTLQYRRMRVAIEPHFISFVVHEYLRERLKKSKEVTRQSYAKMVVDAMVDRLTALLNEALKGALEGNFAVALKSLVNIYSNYAKVECTYSKYLTVDFTITKGGDANIKLRPQMMEELIYDALKVEEINRSIDRVLRSRRERKDFASLMAISKIIDFALLKVFPMRPLLSTLYIPAGRAGLLEGYEAVSSALIALTPTAPLRGISMPPMPGMASEFYALLLQLKGREGPFGKMSDLFKEVIEGDVVLEPLKVPEGKSKMVYRFKFKDRESSVDLIHAASMIKELAPIYLVVRELVDKGHLLIVEEPESHLHPAAQVKLVEVFARLVREGLNVLITTHSDILLRKLAHLVMEGSAEAGADVGLKPEDVAVYLLRPDEKGYVTQEVNILEEMPTFDEVIDQLYEEERDLYYRSLQEEGG